MVVGDLYRYPWELFVLNQLLDAVGDVSLHHESVARLAANHDHVRLLAQYKPENGDGIRICLGKRLNETAASL